MAGGIFISYRREDTAGFAGRIYDRLKTHFDPEYLFLDVDNIDPGLDFFEILSERVGDCDALIAIIGRSWADCRDESGGRRLDNANDFVRIEIEAALERNVRVIPVLMDGAPMPRAEQLPTSLARFARRQNIEISHRYFDTDAGRLVRKLAFVEGKIRHRAEEEAQRLADEEARRQAKAEARRLAETESRRKDEEEAKRRAENEARRRAEAEAQHTAFEEARQKAEIEASRKAAALRKAEEEARRRADEESKHRLAEQETQRLAAATAGQAEDEEHRRSGKDGGKLARASRALRPNRAQLYQRAADQGDANAQFRLGRLYENGKGVRQDYVQAARWFRKAADQDYSLAQYRLGRLYENGKGVRQDYAQAVQWYLKAADQGYRQAQNNLGDIYYYGKGVTQDYIKALRWYIKAADQNYSPAQSNIGWVYFAARDYDQAAQWYRKAADQGDVNGQYSLGMLYENGHGVARDLATARAWYTKAADQGHSVAKDALDRLRKKYPPNRAGPLTPRSRW